MACGGRPPRVTCTTRKGEPEPGNKEVNPMRILMIGAGGVGDAAAKIAVERDFFDAFEARLRSEGAGEAAPPPALPAARALPAWLWLAGGAVVLLLLYLLMR